MVRGAWCAVTRGRHHSLIVKFFIYAIPASKLPVNEEKFTPAPKKIIFLTWEYNFLSEVAVSWAFSEKNSVKKNAINLFLNVQKKCFIIL